MATEDNERIATNSKTFFAEKDAKKAMGVIGYMLLAISGFMAVRIISDDISVAPFKPEDNQFVWFMKSFAAPIRSLLVLIFTTFIGLKLIGSAGKVSARVIPDEDRRLLEPLVAKGEKEAIAQYVILSSLTGFKGTFQKIGFSGLPLATATLTLVFSGLSFSKPEFIEFAKLTLGAFIGSFVQSNVDTDRQKQAMFQPYFPSTLSNLPPAPVRAPVRAPASSADPAPASSADPAPASSPLGNEKKTDNADNSI